MLGDFDDNRIWLRQEYYTTIQLADVDGDGVAELLARTPLGVRVWKFFWSLGSTEGWRELSSTSGSASLSRRDIFAEDEIWTKPEYYRTIQYADIDGDGRAELLARGPDGMIVYQWERDSNGWTVLPAGPALNDTGNWNRPEYYSTIQCADIDGDGAAELIARGSAGIGAFKYDSVNQSWTPLPADPGLSDAVGDGLWKKVEYYSTIQYADIDGDGRAELLARGPDGMIIYQWERDANRWMILPAGPALNDAGNWNRPEYYSTIQCADIDGDGAAELVARGSAGIGAFKYDPVRRDWIPLPADPGLSDAVGDGLWKKVEYYSTIQCADIDGDGRAEVLARGPDGILAYQWNRDGNRWTILPRGPALNDAGNWNRPEYYSTIQCADIDGDGAAELVARGSAGIGASTYGRETGSAQAWRAIPYPLSRANEDPINQRVYGSVYSLEIEFDLPPRHYWHYENAEALQNYLIRIEKIDPKRPYHYRFRLKAEAFANQASHDLLFRDRLTGRIATVTVFVNYESGEGEDKNPNFRRIDTTVLATEPQFTLRLPTLVANLALDSIRYDTNSFRLEAQMAQGDSFGERVTVVFTALKPAFSQKTTQIRFPIHNTQNAVIACYVHLIPAIDLIVDPAQRAPWPYSPEDTTATSDQRAIYRELQKQLGYDPVAAIHDLNIDPAAAQQKILRLEPLPTSGFDYSMWNQVRGQVADLFEAAAHVRQLFANTNNLIQVAYLDKLSTLELIAQRIGVGDNEVASMNIYSALTTGLVIAMTLSGAGASIAVLYTLVDFAATKWLDQQPKPQDTLQGTLSELRQQAMRYFQAVRSNNNVLRDTILSNWGLIRVTSQLIKNRSLEWPAGSQNDLERAARRSFELECWKALLPLRYAIYQDVYKTRRQPPVAQDFVKKPYGDDSEYWLGDKNTAKGVVRGALCRHLFTTQPQDDFDGGLGIPFNDLVHRLNGWQLQLMDEDFNHERFSVPIDDSGW